MLYINWGVRWDKLKDYMHAQSEMYFENCINIDTISRYKS